MVFAYSFEDGGKLLSLLVGRECCYLEFLKWTFSLLVAVFVEFIIV